jgi:hypothetical protein
VFLLDLEQTDILEEYANQAQQVLRSVQANWQATLQQEIRIKDWKGAMEKFCKPSLEN